MRESFDNPDAHDVEEPLVSEGVTPGIVRVGDTVRRPVRPFTATVQEFLSALHARGFHDAPEPLGYDDQGREVLTFVAGDVPREPIPKEYLGTDVLSSLADLIRRQHVASSTWKPPDDAVWGSLPGDDAPGVLPLFDEPELVAHMDYCPGNVVFRGGLPAALIDFDLARPTTRLLDVVNALYWWVPLLHPVDRPPALAHSDMVDIAERVAVFADSYGLDGVGREQLMPLALRRVRNGLLKSRRAAEVSPAFRRMWDNGVRERMPRAQEWTAEAVEPITRRLVRDQ
ncbi:MAG: phosphotransferase [Actinomycetes bacterium]